MYWYLSFVSNKFLGGCFVEAESLQDAVQKTKDLKINPGGEAAIWELSKKPAARYKLNVLLTKEQLGPGKSLKEMTPKEKMIATLGAQRVCACCNGKIH